MDSLGAVGGLYEESQLIADEQGFPVIKLKYVDTQMDRISTCCIYAVSIGYKHDITSTNQMLLELSKRVHPRYELAEYGCASALTSELAV